jgi:hypothetical protein
MTCWITTAIVSARVEVGRAIAHGTSERVTRNKMIKMCKVQWSHDTEEEATWER